MKAPNLSLVNMLKTYCDSKADVTVWNAFYTMYNLGFITHETWLKFYNVCKDLVWDEEKQELIKMFDDDVVKN